MTQLLPDLVSFIEAEEVTTVPEATAYGRSPQFAFNPDGSGYIYYDDSVSLQISDDVRTLLTWIQKAIRTPRGSFLLYGPDYGTDIAAQIGGASSIDALSFNALGDIKRCLLVHPLIVDVRNVQILAAPEQDAVIITVDVADKLTGLFSAQVSIPN